MSWIDRLFGKKEEASLEMDFEELPDWLGSKSEKIYRNISRHAESMYPDINDAISEIKKSTAFLEKVQPDGRYHLKMVKIGTSNRDNMVKQVKMLIENVTIPGTSDIRTIRIFHERAMHSLNVCLDNMMKSHQYTKIIFVEESKAVIADVNRLRRILEQFIQPVNEQKNTIDALQDSEDAIENIKNTFYDIDVEKKKLTKNDKNIMTLKKEIQEKQVALEKLKDSDSWKQYLDKKNELSQLEHKARKTESEIDALVLPLNKGLNRLKQLSDSGRYTLNPQIREGLYACLSDRKSADITFFVEFKNIVESDTLNLSPDKRDKMAEHIKLVISSLDTYKKDHKNLIHYIEKKKNEISKLDIRQKEENLKDRITELQYKLETSEKELEALKNHLNSLEESIELKKQGLQDAVSIIEPGMKVSF